MNDTAVSRAVPFIYQDLRIIGGNRICDQLPVPDFSVYRPSVNVIDWYGLLFLFVVWRLEYPSDPGLEEGFQPLFDGRTLEGWHKLGGESSFRIVGGELLGRHGPGDNTFLRTEKTYSDPVGPPLRSRHGLEGMLVARREVITRSLECKRGQAPDEICGQYVPLFGLVAV